MVRPKLRLLTLSILASLSLAFGFAPAVYASVYGGGSYGACAYGQGCSSSSSGSTTPAAVQPTTVILNDFSDYFSDSGKSLDLSANQIVYFDVTSGGQTVRYSVTVKQVGDNFVVITISGVSGDVRFNVGETKQFDVNGDGINDIEITLVSISGGVATFKFKAIVLSASTTRATTPAAVASAGTPHTSRLGLILSILAILIALFIFFILWRRRRKRDEQPGPQ